MSENDTTEKIDEHLEFKDILKETGTDKKSHKQVIIENKLGQLLRFQESFLNNQMKRINEKAFIEFNSSIINECRSICSNLESLTLDNKEKFCLKNCFSKFYNEVNVLRKVEGEIMNSFGPEIYIHAEEDKKCLKEIFNLIEKKRTDIYQSTLKV